MAEAPPPDPSPWTRALLALAFMATGASGLVLEVVWQRRLALLFGNTVEATGAVLAAFLGSLALGGALLGPLADRVRRPLRLYALLELAAGLGALLALSLSPLVGAAADSAYRAAGGEGLPLTAIRCLLAVALIAPAAVPMGATLPALAAALAPGRRPGDQLGLLYGLNTLGAACGAALAGFVLVLALGLRGTWIAAAVVDLALGAAVLFLAGGRAPVPAAARPAPAAAAPARREGVSWTLAALVFVAGAAFLALEVLWTRALLLHLGSQVATFALVLALVLLGLGAGALAGGRLSETGADRLEVAGLMSIAAAAAGAVSVLALERTSDLLGGVASALGVHTYWGTVLVQAMAAAQVVLVPAFLAGTIFPLALRHGYRREEVGRGVGRLIAASTAGAILGSLGTAFLLVPAMGVGRAFGVVTGIQALLGLGVVLARGARLRPALAGAVALVLAFLVLLARARPLGKVLLLAGVFQDGETQVLFHRDGRHGLITVEERRAGDERYRLISVNGVNVAGTAPDLVTVQKLQAHIPLLLHGRARSVLHIGVGSGGTAASAALYPLERIDVVELNPHVPLAADRFFREVNRGILFAEPRLHLVYGDGRTVLASGSDRYDVILSDSIHPRYAGNGSLYTRDYYRLCRARLNPGGLVSQWLPLYSLPPDAYRSILRAFLDVFPEATLWYPHGTLNPNTILVGAVAGFHFGSGSLAAQMSDPAIARDLAEAGIHGPDDFLSNFVAGRRGLARLAGSAEPHTDDRPVVEYAAGRIHGEHFSVYREWTWRENLQALLAVREPWDEARGGSLSRAVGDKIEGYVDQLARSQP